MGLSGGLPGGVRRLVAGEGSDKSHTVGRCRGRRSPELSDALSCQWSCRSTVWGGTPVSLGDSLSLMALPILFKSSELLFLKLYPRPSSSLSPRKPVRRRGQGPTPGNGLHGSR